MAIRIGVDLGRTKHRGGGRLYRSVPPLLARYAFSDSLATRLVPPLHGDSSGVRGAAWLWTLDGLGGR